MSAMLSTNSLKGGGSSLKMVRKRYSDLNNLIGELSSKLSEVSSSIDSEFLLAYKYHMLDVQRDLQSLKQQVAVAEAALHDDRAVATLENEVNWFLGEIAQSKSHAVNMREDLSRIVSSISAIKIERNVLNDVLKRVLKHSSVLENEINQGAMLLFSSRRNPSNELASRSQSREQLFHRKHPTSTVISKQSIKDLKSDNLLEAFSTSAVQSSNNLPISLGNDSNDSQCLRNRPRARSANSTIMIMDDTRLRIDELLANRNSDEALLEKELYNIFKETVMSKKLSARYHESHDSKPQWDDEEEKKQMLDQCRRMGGVTGLGLDHFSHQSRLEAMQNYLKHPVIFEQVVQVLAMRYTENNLKSK